MLEIEKFTARIKLRQSFHFSICLSETANASSIVETEGGGGKLLLLFNGIELILALEGKNHSST